MPSPEETIFSPHASVDGNYPIFTSEQKRVTDLNQLLHEKGALDDDESLSALVSPELVEQAMDWFIDEVLFKKINEYGAENVILTYNRRGAWWFMRRLKNRLVERGILEKGFSLEDFKSNIAEVLPIRVTSSSGYQEFNRNAQFIRWFNDDVDLTQKCVISLDDIGDRGVTQRLVVEKLKQMGAKEAIAVNLVEKLVPSNIDDDKKKVWSPNYALLTIAYIYALGEGLDSGKGNIFRETKLRNIPGVVGLQQATTA